LIATLAPSLAKASASALPRPWLAPVMSVTLSSSMFLPFGSISASQHISTSPVPGDFSALQQVSFRVRRFWLTSRLKKPGGVLKC
jgi:hypothetical protein